MKTYKHGEMVFSIQHKNGEKSYINWDAEEEGFVSEGYIGDGWTFYSIKGVLKYLQGFDIHINDIYF